MKSLTEIYRKGMGPSSSHTMGPRRAAEIFSLRQPQAASFRVALQGSLAATGKGHLTDQAILKALPKAEIIWRPEFVPEHHPNGMLFEAFDTTGRLLEKWQVYSVGGGALFWEGFPDDSPEVYKVAKAADLLSLADSGGNPFWHLVFRYENDAGIDIELFLSDVWNEMKESINRGLTQEEPLPGCLNLNRRAKSAYLRSNQLNDRRTARVSAYALAVAEENSGGGMVVTAPTCGSSGVVPAVFRFLAEEMSLTDSDIVKALATAGLFGNLIKHNASISGAAVGCQGEIGAACSMAAAGAAQLLGGTPHQIEYAAEIALEHYLGLTCDPVAGLVQIPCIERNALSALKALTCAEYALMSDGRHRVSFDQVVDAMKETGQNMPSLYRETSTGGLALRYKSQSGTTGEN